MLKTSKIGKRLSEEETLKINEAAWRCFLIFLNKTRRWTADD